MSNNESVPVMLLKIAGYLVGTCVAVFGIIWLFMWCATSVLEYVAGYF